MTTDQHVRSADGTSIAYQRTGHGPLVIMVDPAGAFSGLRPMPDLTPALAPHLSVVTYDRRGRGESTDTPPYAVEREVEDLAALIEAAGGAPAGVYGFSSGAVLALRAAAAGVPIRKLALLEPPLELDQPAAPAEPATSAAPGRPAPERSDQPDLRAEVAELVAAGRRGDAVIHFNTSIGVPPELIAGLREHPAWPGVEALAHTLVYDLTVTGSTTADQLAAVRVPALVVTSEGSDDRLHRWGRRVAEVLPAGEHRRLPGRWHGPEVEELAAALVRHFTGRASPAGPAGARFEHLVEKG